MLFDGRNGGTVEVLETGLVIRRKGVLSALNQGLKGEKRIPFSSITSVQFKDAGFTTGYIQFGMLGGNESRTGVWDAVKDENTILFTKETSADFRRLKALVEERIHENGAPAPSAGSVSDELLKLADLRERGILTDEEFAEQKRRILSGAAAPSTHAPRPDPSPPKPIGPTPNEPIDGKKMGAGRMAGIGCAVILGLFVLLAALGSSIDNSVDNASATSSETASLLETETDAGTGTDTPAEPQSSWSYSEDTDKVRGGTSYYASTTSTNSIAQDFPYEGDTRMRMTVRKSPAYGTDVILTISSGQMMCPSYEGCSGTVRFDDGAPSRINFAGPEDNSSETIFVEGAKGFVAKLKKAKKVTIEKTLYQAGAPQFEFDVAGLEWDH